MARDFSKQFYKSKEWKQVRNFCLLRDNFLCVRCGQPAEEVHHIIHLTPINIHDITITLNPANLICLCRDCHFAEHKQDRLNGIAEANGLPQNDFYFDEFGMLQRR